MGFRRLAYAGAVALALAAATAAHSEDEATGVAGAAAAAPGQFLPADALTRDELETKLTQIRQEARSQRDISGLRMEQLEREIERSTSYIQNLLVAFLIAGGIVVFLVLNAIRHQSRVNNYRMRQLIRDSEKALGEIDRVMHRPEAEHFQIARRLGRAMNHMREHEQALPQKYVSDIYTAAEDPTLPATLHYQANALRCEQAADWRQAVYLWETLHRMDESNPEILLHLARCYKHMADLATGPEASTHRDTSLRFFQLYTRRTRQARQEFESMAEGLPQRPVRPPAGLQPAQRIEHAPHPPARPALIPAAPAQPVRPAPAAMAPPPPIAAEPVVQPPASPAPAPAALAQPVEQAPAAVPTPPPAAAPAPQPAAPVAYASPPPNPAGGNGIARAAGKAVLHQAGAVTESASKLGSSLKRVGSNVAAGIYSRIKNVELGALAGNSEPIPETPPKVAPPPPVINYYREESRAVSSANGAAAPAQPAAAQPAASMPAKAEVQQGEEAPAVRPSFAQPSIKLAEKAAAPKKPAEGNGVAKDKPARKRAKRNRSAHPEAKQASTGSNSEKPAKKAAGFEATKQFRLHMQEAEECLSRYASATAKADRDKWLQGAIEEFEAAAKHSTSVSMYRLWGKALLEAVQEENNEDREKLLEQAIDRLAKGERIKPGGMAAELALAYAMAGREDDCRLALERCVLGEDEGVAECLEHSGFDPYRKTDWFANAHAQVPA